MTAYTCFSRYLSAKKTIDDRALNHHVWQTLVRALPQRPLRILEVGAGIGTMIERTYQWGLCPSADYTALDAEASNIAVLRHRIAKQAWGQWHITPIVADLFDFLPSAEPHQYDLLIAHAFLDLVHLPTTLPPLLRLLKPQGHFYFTINFDGITAFEPPLDPLFDQQIEQCYHQTMDDRLYNGQPSGDSRAGRHLLTHIRQAGGTFLAVGSSDWVVHADETGRYSADEAYFLHFIIETMHNALQHHPALDPIRFANWIAQRHQQITEGELIYLAHQLDLCGTLKSAEPQSSPNP